MKTAKQKVLQHYPKAVLVKYSLVLGWSKLNYTYQICNGEQMLSGIFTTPRDAWVNALNFIEHEQSKNS